MDNTRSKNPSQATSPDSPQFTLPPGFFVGVIPPDGTMLILPIWMLILGLDDSEKDAFVKQINRLNIPKQAFCKQVVIDASHIRKLIAAGGKSDEA